MVDVIFPVIVRLVVRDVEGDLGFHHGPEARSVVRSRES
jgi:hypothetical protein